MRVEKKRELMRRRRWRIRKKISGTSKRPRMSVRFTGRHIYVQFVDDVNGQTLAGVSTLKNADGDKSRVNVSVDLAASLGQSAAKLAVDRGIKKVVFDRNGARYHGRIKALAEAARDNGLEF